MMLYTSFLRQKVIFEAFLMVFLFVKLSCWVDTKRKQITSHFSSIWASDFSHFPNFEQIRTVCYCHITEFSLVMIVIFTNSGQIMHLFVKYYFNWKKVTETSYALYDLLSKQLL